MFCLFHVLGIIIPSGGHIFQRGAQPPTTSTIHEYGDFLGLHPVLIDLQMVFSRDVPCFLLDPVGIPHGLWQKKNPPVSYWP